MASPVTASITASELRTTLREAWLAQHPESQSESEQVLATPEELAQLNGFDIPTPAEAEHLLRELDWTGRFTGMDVNAAAGECTLRFYSLAEVAKFFRFGTAGLGFARGGGGSVSVAKVEEIIAWVRDKVQDTVLAGALERDVDLEESYQDCIQVISRLLNMRVTQLTQLAAKS